MEKKIDIFAKITDRIVAELENGALPWRKPWNTGKATVASGSVFGNLPLRHTMVPYSGINVLILWSAAAEKGYTNQVWMTYKQAADYGGFVRKGEKAEAVVYASKFKKEETAPSGKVDEKWIPFLKTFFVFNVEQIDNLPPRFYADTAEPKKVTKKEATRIQNERIAHAEEFLANLGADVRHTDNSRAYYSPAFDHINMPVIECFKDSVAYYAVSGHEHVHWTMHKDRCNRDALGKRWGDEVYAREELVAELGSAFLCGLLGLSLDPRPDHASYLASWLKVLKGDKRAIFNAASEASKALDYMIKKQPNYVADDAEDEKEAA